MKTLKKEKDLKLSPKLNKLVGGRILPDKAIEGLVSGAGRTGSAGQCRGGSTLMWTC
ncbi:MAG: hypothetical protein H0T84_00345 [Tatlockia sp.]|nr:hypothetical protein [Tatlockia sp.]